MNRRRQENIIRQGQILTAFFEDKEYDFQAIVEGDCAHDGWACLNGEKTIALELTELRNEEHLEAINFWNEQIQSKIDSNRRSWPCLRRVRIYIDFHQPLPKLGKDLDCFVDQLLRGMAAVWNERNKPTSTLGGDHCPVQNVFVEARHSVMRQFDRCEFPLTHYFTPLVCKFVQGVHLSTANEDWPYLVGPDAKGGSPQYEPKTFVKIIRDKADRAKSYQIDGNHLWLIIACNQGEDVRTEVVDHTRMLQDVLKCSIRENSDFDPCPFEKIWLFGVSNRISLQVYP